MYLSEKIITGKKIDITFSSKNIGPSFGFSYWKIFQLGFSSRYFKGFKVLDPVLFGSVPVLGCKYVINVQYV